MNGWVILFLVVPGLFALGYGWHRLATWMADRGWIYYRDRRAPRGAGSMAFMDVAAMAQPQVEHVVEEARSEKLRTDVTESGDDSGPSIR